jgi:hypothetical protein
VERITHSKEKMELVRGKIQELIKIVSDLEMVFPGRHFTIDGHLVGSIGEVMAAYYYGIDLYDASTEKHDGVVDGREVQIKITQQDNITISAEPDYLIVLYMNKNGNIYEVYNGPGNIAWESASKADSHNNHHMRVNRLMKLDADVCAEDRIIAINPIEKMKAEYKNKK